MFEVFVINIKSVCLRTHTHTADFHNNIMNCATVKFKGAAPRVMLCSEGRAGLAARGAYFISSESDPLRLP